MSAASLYSYNDVQIIRGFTNSNPHPTTDAAILIFKLLNDLLFSKQPLQSYIISFIYQHNSLTI